MTSKSTPVRLLVNGFKFVLSHLFNVDGGSGMGETRWVTDRDTGTSVYL